MKKYLSLLVTGLLALPLATFAGPTEFYSPIPVTGSVAGSLDYDGSADGGYTNVDVNNSASPTVHYAGQGGQMQGYFSTAATALVESSNPASMFFRFFCIDLYQSTSNSPTAYSASQYSDSNMQKLYDVAYPNQQLGDFFNGSTTTSFGTFSSSDYSTAFQLALWELRYETGGTHSLNTGNFTDALGTSVAHTIANQWLSQVDSYAGSGYQNWQLYGFASNTNQDFLSARFTVPEPGSLLLAGLGLIGLAMTSRRRRNQV